MQRDDASTLPRLGDRFSIREKDLTSGITAEPDPNNPAWGLGGAILVLFLSICLVVVVQPFLVIPYALSKGFTLNGPEQVRALAEFATTDRIAIILQILALLPIHLLTLFMIWALVTRFGRRPFWSAIGWGWGRFTPMKGWVICTGVGVVMFIVGNVVAKLLGGDRTTPLEQVINSSLAARYLISFFAVATAPIVEELLYRGVLYAPLQKLAGVNAAVVAVVAVFTVIHVPQYWPNPGVIFAVGLLSITLTVIRAASGRLLPCVVVHLVFNGIMAVLLVLEPYLQRFIPTPDPVTPPATILQQLIGAFI